ncbi:MAG TPA: hypothetical protein VFI45_12360, partial [Candidatus Acidoferrum sp.]|nr:hypothetical protein [Candidatus Acidoferrum sp.]
QPEESTIASLESLGVVTIFIFPLHALCDAPELFDRARAMQTDRPVQNVDLELFTWFQPQQLSNILWDNYLKFWRDLNSSHESVLLSIQRTCYRNYIDTELVCQFN